MGELIVLFEETKKRFPFMNKSGISTVKMNDEDFNRIEAELIKFADELSIAM